MQKDNLVENRFKAVKKLVHDDPVAMDFVNQFHKEFRAAKKVKKIQDIIFGAVIIASAITLILVITDLFVKIGTIWAGLTLTFSGVCTLLLYITSYITIKFNREEIDYVNACLEEWCPNTATQYPVIERAGQFFVNVDDEMQLVDKSYLDAAIGDDICVIYMLYQLDKYEGVICKKRH